MCYDRRRAEACVDESAHHAREIEGFEGVSPFLCGYREHNLVQYGCTSRT